MGAMESAARRPQDPEALHDAFLAAARQNPINPAILERMPTLALPDLWLVAGCLFQAVWNLRDGRPAGADVRDYDLFYFDDSDLSWAAEDRAIRRCAALFADLGGTSAASVPGCVASSSRDGRGAIEIYAPYGLADIFDGRLRANPNVREPALFARKAESYRRRWPWLTLDDRLAES